MGGALEQRIAMWIATGILMLLTLLLLFVLYPMKELRVEGSPETWSGPRRPVVSRLPNIDDGFNPSTSNDTARISVFGLGSMARWTFTGGDTTMPKKSLDTIAFLNLLRPSNPVITTSHGGDAMSGITGEALGTTVIRKERSQSADDPYSTSRGYPGGTANRGRGLDRAGAWMRHHGAKTLRGGGVDMAPLRS